MSPQLTNDQWLVATLHLLSTLMVPVQAVDAWPAVRELRDALARDARAPATLDAGMRRILMPFMKVRTVLRGDPHRGTVQKAQVAKAALLAHAALSGRWDLVSPHERVRVRDALASRLDTMPPMALPDVDYAPPSLVVDGARRVRFAHAWQPMGDGVALAAAAGETYLGEVASEAAPVVCSLPAPGGTLSVRRHGTSWLRPVLSPGSWDPVDVATFSRAAASGEAWVDSPFLPATPRGRPALAMWDHAEHRTPTFPENARIDVARDAVLVRAGRLVVVDGVVHRGCGEPMVDLRVRGGALVVGWTLDGLSEGSNPDTLRGEDADDPFGWLAKVVAAPPTRDEPFALRLAAPFSGMLADALGRWRSLVPEHGFTAPMLLEAALLAPSGRSTTVRVDDAFSVDPMAGLRLVIDLSDRFSQGRSRVALTSIVERVRGHVADHRAGQDVDSALDDVREAASELSHDADLARARPVDRLIVALAWAALDDACGRHVPEPVDEGVAAFAA